MGLETLYAPGLLRGLSAHVARANPRRVVSGRYRVGDQLRVSDYRRVRDRDAAILKSSELAEPLERAAHLGQFQLVATAELFEPHAFETGPFERSFHQIMRLRRRDRIA